MLENIRCAFKLHLKLKNFKVNYDKNWSQEKCIKYSNILCMLPF